MLIRSMACRILAATTMFAVVSSAGPAGAQTGYSMRLRALSVRFAGIVDDAISDAFLNPAQVSAVPGTDVYVARHPDDSYRSVYPIPIHSRFDDSYLPEELLSRGTALSYAPYEITLFLDRASISIELYSSTYDNLEDYDDVAARPYGVADLSVYEDLYGYRYGETHIRATAAYSTASEPNGRGVGVRGSILYRREDYANVRSDFRIRSLDSPAEIEADYGFELNERDFDQLDATVSAGLHHPDSGLRDLIGAFSWVRQEYDAGSNNSRWFDEDIDGNGFDIWGTIPEAEWQAVRLNTSRVYQGPRLYGRMHADLTDDVRFTMSASWEDLSGDGDATFKNAFENTLAFTVQRSVEIDYGYDGSERRYGLEGSVGMRRDVTPDVLFACALYSSWNRLNFAEDATGNGELRAAQPSDTTSVASPYTQRVLRLDDVFRAIAPAAVEWRPKSYLQLRLGAELWFEYTDREDVRRRTVAVDQTGVPYTVENRWHRTDSFTRLVVNSGVAVYLAERLFIDLTASRDSYVDLASYSYLSLRYRF